ncbi:extracellular solute-binding protein [Mycetocola tolaasinivorans]|uniref:Extracellular solute-binding protein n=1 Tax=Mycetocola tolaasinivorans TaxID=76635 RepID=A0A3L7AA35_9MICO|nr:extracellular solute-binding protein [Mycetocola tolaasinivorans]RLP76915.1 extracellular solute-binding protein [Mycetocola tolaasinivorans]
MVELTRRHLVALGFAGLGTALLSGCTTPGQLGRGGALNPSSPEVVTLNYWTWLKDMQPVADIWNRNNPHIQVRVTPIPQGNNGGYQKMYAALAAGGGPDLGQVEYRNIPEFLLAGGLTNIADAGALALKPRYDPTLWQQVSFLDGVYALPQDSGPMALYYHRPLLESVGATPPKTWEEWAEIAVELRQKRAWMDCFSLSDAGPFISYATQAGARWVTPERDGWRVNLLDEPTLTVARFFDRALDRKLLLTEYGPFSPPWFAAAAADRIASVTSASWADAIIADIQGGAGKWGVAPMPRWGHTGYGSSALGGSTVGVLAHGKHPREAVEFAAWLTSERAGIDAEISRGIGWSPTPDYIGAARSKPAPFFGGQRYNEEIMIPAAADQNPDWSWWPITQQSFNILADEFRKKAAGQSLVDGLRSAERLIIRAMRNKGLTVHTGAAS